MDVRTFCRICNAMCGLIVTVDEQTVTRIRGDEDHPLSRGYCCPKGRLLGELHHSELRLDHPLIVSDAARIRTDWPTAIEDIAQRVRSSIDFGGPDSVAMYLASGSAFDTAGRRAAERFLAKLGSKQKYTATTIDTPSKPLIAELIGGWSGLTPIWDHERSNLLLLFGSNPIVSHGHSNALPDPVRRLREFKDRGGALWVIDPRRTETALAASHHLQNRPGTDWLILGWLVRRLLAEHPAASSIDRRAVGVDRLADAVGPLSDDFVTRVSGVSIDDLGALLGAIIRSGRVSALTGTGVSMSASANITEYLLWAMHIITDSYDAPGGMWFNPGFLLQLDTRELPRSDGSPESGPPSRPTLPRRFGEYPCAALVPEIEAGNITTLFVVGGNPMTALPETERTRNALASLDTLVVIDIVPTETTQLATHVLPAVDQLERGDLTWLLDSYQLAVAAQRTEPVVEPLGQRRPVWRMFADIAARLDIDLLGTETTDRPLSEAQLLDQVVARSRLPRALRETTQLVVDSGAVYGWVSERVLHDSKWRLGPQQLLEQLSTAISEARTGDHGTVVLIPTRRLHAMNSQFVQLGRRRNEGNDHAIHVSPLMAHSLGSPSRVSLSTPHGSITTRVVEDRSLRDDVVTLTHGDSDANVCSLTSTDEAIDPLSGMVLQSGLEVTLRRAD